MAMIPIQNKEHLVYFMQCGMLRLSRHDLKFLQNIMTLTTQNKSLTTNQTELFERLVKKYKRQLLKHGIDESKLDSLKWETDIISSDPQFTEAFVSIDQGVILFRSPFSKKFLNKFSKAEVNTFKWNKEEKVYKSPYSIHALKFIVNIANEFYPKVNYCETLAKKLAEFNSYKEGYWNPTLVRSNNYYFIAATNQYIDDAIKEVELSSDPKTISLLAWHGIDIDPSITGDDPLLLFSSKYIAEVDIKDIDLLIEHLKSIRCKQVIFYGPGAHNAKEKFKNAEIDTTTYVVVANNSLIQQIDSATTVLIITRPLITAGHPLVSKGNCIKVVHLKNTKSIPIGRM